MCISTVWVPHINHCIFRTLGTPNNDVWPDVESLPDYKNTFPKWKGGNLSVKNLEKNGLDLLAVRIPTAPCPLVHLSCPASVRVINPWSGPLDLIFTVLTIDGIPVVRTFQTGLIHGAACFCSYM